MSPPRCDWKGCNEPANWKIQYLDGEPDAVRCSTHIFGEPPKSETYFRAAGIAKATRGRHIVIVEDEVSDEFDSRKYAEVEKELESKRPRGVLGNSLADLLRCEVRNPVFVEVKNEEDLEFEDPVDREVFVDVNVTPKEENSE